MLTQGGINETEKVVFVGWSIQGYGVFTSGTYDVCTDPMNKEETEFRLYHHSLGTWSPIDKIDDDLIGWYFITYRRTSLGKKLINVETV